MHTQMNRTKMIFNATLISLVIFLIQGILTLIRTRVFIGFYGTDTNGIVELSSQIFSYIVLLESGLGAAYLFKMYEPMANKDYSKINGLYKGFSKSIKKIAIIMLLVLIIIAIIYPSIIKNNSLSYIKMVLIIILLGIRFILPYYLTVDKKNLLYIYEKKHIVNLTDGLANIAILALEIFLCVFVKLDILIVLCIGIIINLMLDYIYKKLINKNCSEVASLNCEPDYEAKKMTKDILVHQISSVVFSSTDNVILSILDSLNSVTIYSAYNTVLTYPVTLINKITDNLRATFGKKIVENEDQAIEVFNETLSLNYFLVAIIAPIFLLCINDFVKLWIGEQFILDNLCVIIWTLLFIHRCIMPTIYIARDAKGLYKESKNYTLWQAIVNIVLSLILVWNYGILGLLIGTVISTYLILIPFNYNLVSKKVLKSKNYLLRNLIIIIIYVATISIACLGINNLLGIAQVTSWISLIFKATIDTMITVVISSITMYIFNKYYRKLIKRFLHFEIKIKFFRNKEKEY